MGTIFTVANGVVLTSRCFETDDQQLPNQWMFGMRAVGTDVFAVGMNYSSPRRSSGTWHGYFSADLLIDEPLGGFMDIDGVREESLIAVGTEGAIWKMARTAWVQVDSPSSVTFRSIRMNRSGKFWIAGQHGTVVRW
jgi:hypothetical protein